MVLTGNQGISASGRYPGPPDIERDPDRLIVPDILSHQAMGTHTIPVIRRQYDNRIFFQALPVQIFHDPAEIIIQSFYGSVVLCEFLSERFIGS